jgi:hypothetical protein
LKIFFKSNGQSLPIAPKNLTGEKKLAAILKYTAEPPKQSLLTPNGVFTVSIPIEPVTNSDILNLPFCYSREGGNPEKLSGFRLKAGMTENRRGKPRPTIIESVVI